MTTPDYSTTRRLTSEKPACFDTPVDGMQTLLKTPDSEQKIAEGGLRLHGLYKSSSEDKPLITVVTVVYNGAEFLEETIKSVIEQTYDNVEYIIVDGGSTDGTLDIIRKYQHAIDYWVSEPDKGIYDAMNKGVYLASGKWVNFMNAGDKLINFPDLKKISCNSLIYGNAIIYPNKRLNTPKKITSNDFCTGMIICHQACFYPKNSFVNFVYDTRYRICSDQITTAKIVGEYGAIYCETDVVYYDVNGLSSRNDFLILREKIRINREMHWSLIWPFFSLLKTVAVRVRDYFK